MITAMFFLNITCNELSRSYKTVHTETIAKPVPCLTAGNKCLLYPANIWSCAKNRTRTGSIAMVQDDVIHRNSRTVTKYSAGL